MFGFAASSPLVASTKAGFLSGKTSIAARHGRRVHAARSKRVFLMASATAVEEDTKAETFEFQAEVSRVMTLIINSLYSNKDIFLRELVSNAADACDKRRFLSVSGGEAADDLGVFVKADKDAGTITIEDTGVGMTRQELINNLGSIATSGTSKFMEALGDGKKDLSLIGQFGVGFYSAYLVADQVSVTSKSHTDSGASQYRWDSTANSTYTITEDNSVPLKGGVGTRIVLTIKEDCKEFLENSKLNELMKRYSEFIPFPISGWTERTEYDDVPDGDEKDDDGNPKMKKVPRTVEEWTQVNKLKPIWMRKAREVKDEEYTEFYKQIAKDWQAPMEKTHFAVEGDVEFRSILFVPPVLPSELRQNMFEEKGRQLKLYVKRVFISDTFDDILPRWLSFIRGVVDSEDLPLNVSREILQKSRVLRIISKRLVRKTIDMFTSIKSRGPEEYGKFWKEFGRYIKAGIIENGDHIDTLTKLTLWPSTNSKTEFTFMEDYVSRMKEGQKDIYYVAAASRVEGESAPVMEKLMEMGYEVLFMIEPIDEICVQNLAAFKCKKNEDDKEETTFTLTDISKEGFKMDDLKSEEQKKEDEKLSEDYKTVVDFFQSLLSDKVGKVQLSDKLTESPSTIIQSSFGMSPTMERYMKEVGSAGANGPEMQSYLSKSRTLEINPKHPIIADIKSKLESKVESDDNSNKQAAMLVYELALLTGGYPLDSSSAFAKRVSSLVSAAIEAPEVVVPPPPPAGGAEAFDPNSMNMDEMMKNMNNMKDMPNIKEMLETEEGKNAMDMLNKKEEDVESAAVAANDDGIVDVEAKDSTSDEAKPEKKE